MVGLQGVKGSANPFLLCFQFQFLWLNKDWLQNELPPFKPLLRGGTKGLRELIFVFISCFLFELQKRHFFLKLPKIRMRINKHFTVNICHFHFKNATSSYI